MQIEFESPAVFLLLVGLVPLLLWRFYRRPAAPALVFPTIAHVRSVRPTFRQRGLKLLPLFQIAAVCLLVAAGARPRRGDARTIIRQEGVAIQMVLDRSGSMEEKIRYRGQARAKIEVVKDIFEDFVSGSDDLSGRKTDLIGLTTFARFPEESCPLVSLHEPLLTAVKNLRTVAPFLTKYRQATRNRREAVAENPLNATAIGDGLYRAVLSLITAEDDLARGNEDKRYHIKGRAVIVLTDGLNNTGRSPLEAGEYAAANGVKVYFIVLMDRNLYRQSLTGPVVARQLSKAETDGIMEAPRQIAEQTGGQAWFAADGDELREVYRQIDRLERSEIGKVEFRSYKERYHYCLIPAVALLLFSMLLGETVLRRIP
jgi:Ca-activated chloride channel family protein